MKTLNIFKITLIVFSFFTLTFTSGCKEKGCTDPLAANYNPDAKESDGNCVFPALSLHFHSLVGEDVFAFNTVYNINGTAVSFTTAQFYVSGIQVGGDGEFDTNEDKYLLVTADKSVYEVGEITTGHKHMLMFNVGVDSVANHSDPTTYATDHPLAPKNPNMHWSWNSGYIFIKIEGLVDTNADGTPEAQMELHIGTDAKLTPVALTAHKEVATEEETIHMEVDFAKLFTGIDLTTERITHTGDDPGLAAKLVANVPSAFSVEEE
ncbi:MAG: MbnP family protein [Bacteroidia bacterium]|nr:MbnP family protein [Bacteroidia bacterium]